MIHMDILHVNVTVPILNPKDTITCFIVDNTQCCN